MPPTGHALFTAASGARNAQRAKLSSEIDRISAPTAAVANTAKTSRPSKTPLTSAPSAMTISVSSMMLCANPKKPWDQTPRGCRVSGHEPSPSASGNSRASNSRSMSATVMPRWGDVYGQPRSEVYSLSVKCHITGPDPAIGADRSRCKAAFLHVQRHGTVVDCSRSRAAFRRW